MRRHTTGLIAKSTIKYATHLLIMKTNYYKFHRKFWQLPANGQRTWSNGRTPKKTVSIFKEYERVKHFKLFNFNCPPRQQEMILMAEYLNKL